MQFLPIQTRSKIVETARKYLGVKWFHQGRNMNGLDCVGVVVLTANDLGLSTYETTDYARGTSGDPFCDHFIKAGMVPVHKTKVLPGDVVLTEDRNFPCHCGIVGEKDGKLTFIHGYAKRRRVVEDPLSMWESKITYVMRFPQLED